MRKLIVLLSAFALLSSCSRYYINTLESPNTKKIEATGEFQFENDTLIITYNFHGMDAPVSIDCYNKLNEPLYINWQKSALIKGDQAVSYMGKQVSFNGNLSGTSSKDIISGNSLNQRNYDAKIIGAAALPEEISFIPPKSRIKKIPLKISGIDYKNIADTAYQRTFIPLNGTPGVWGKEVNFNPQNSPLNFKSYLTFYTEKENIQNNFSLHQDFYISNLIRTGTNPKGIVSLESKPGNVFYLIL